MLFPTIHPLTFQNFYLTLKRALMKAHRILSTRHLCSRFYESALGGDGFLGQPGSPGPAVTYEHSGPALGSLGQAVRNKGNSRHFQADWRERPAAPALQPAVLQAPLHMSEMSGPLPGKHLSKDILRATRDTWSRSLRVCGASGWAHLAFSCRDLR